MMLRIEAKLLSPGSIRAENLISRSLKSPSGGFLYKIQEAFMSLSLRAFCLDALPQSPDLWSAALIPFTKYGGHCALGNRRRFSILVALPGICASTQHSLVSELCSQCSAPFTAVWITNWASLLTGVCLSPSCPISLIYHSCTTAPGGGAI